MLNKTVCKIPGWGNFTPLSFGAGKEGAAFQCVSAWLGEDAPARAASGPPGDGVLSTAHARLSSGACGHGPCPSPAGADSAEQEHIQVSGQMLPLHVSLA